MARLLHLAVCSGNARLLSMLLAAGADRTATDNHGATPLYLAAQSGLYPIVTFQYSSTTSYQVSYHIQCMFV
jgi:ankyrin repeat protein